jgi:hypothetical protein
VKQYFDAYIKICKDYGILNIHNPFDYGHKFINKEHLVTNALTMLKVSMDNTD